jgi:hypothetical protein
LDTGKAVIRDFVNATAIPAKEGVHFRTIAASVMIHPGELLDSE